MTRAFAGRPGARRMSPGVTGWLAAVLTTLLVAVLPGAGASGLAAHHGPGEVKGVLDPGLVIQTVVGGLDRPTNVVFDPSGNMFVTTKPGLLLRYAAPAYTAPQTILDLRVSTYDNWDRGLLGMTLDPKFAAGRPYLYVLQTYDKDPFGLAKMPRWGTGGGTEDVCPAPPGATNDGCTASGRLLRYTINANGTINAAGTKVLLDGTTTPGGGWCQQFPSHSIGRVEFGPDGALYVGAGDGASFNAVDYGQFGTRGGPTPPNPCNDRPGARGTALTAATSAGGALRAQAVRTAPAKGFVSWDGAILRINPDTGLAAAGNPLLNNGIAGDDRIVAYGLRNPFRFAFRPGTNQLWLGDVGWGAWEETNWFATGPTQKAVPNFGWPCYEGKDRSMRYDAANVGLCEQLFAKPAQNLGGVASPLVAPLAQLNHKGAYPTGCNTSGGGASVGGQFLTGTSWPAKFRGGYLFGDFARRCLMIMPTGGGTQPDPTKTVAVVDKIGPVAIRRGPGDALYVVDIVGGKILRLSGAGGNRPPLAKFTATPATSDTLPMTVRFDASASSDPEGKPLTFAWDLDGDDVCDDATGVRTSWTYRHSATVTTKVCVTDAAGQVAVASRVIHADNTDPTVTAMVSSTATGWAVGDVITFTAVGRDAEDGVLPESAYEWTLVMRHCAAEGDEDACHTHPLRVASGSSVSLKVPDHEYYAYVRAWVTVHDSVGGTKTVRIDALPRVSTIIVETLPAGIPVSVGGASGASPVTGKFLEHGLAELIVPPRTKLAGKTYAFVRWTDNPDAIPDRKFKAKPGTNTYVAEYKVVAG